MEYLIIFGVITILLFLMSYFTIPYKIWPLAKNAGFKRISFRYRIILTHKIPVNFILEQFVRASEVNVSLDFDDLKDYYLTTDEEKTRNMVNVLIRAKRAGVRITINELEKFEISGGDVEQLVTALKIVKNASIDISRDVLETHSLYGGNIETFVEIMLRSKKANLQLNLQELVEENLTDEAMKQVVDVLIRAKKSELYISEAEYSELKKGEDGKVMDLRISQKSILEHYRAKIDIEKYVNAMIRAKKAGIDIDKEALNIHYLTDGDMEKLVKTMIQAERAGIEISQTDLVKNNLEGRDVGNIIKYIIRAKQAGIEITADELIEFNRIDGDVDDFVNALIMSKKFKLGIGKKELLDHHLAGAKIMDYVKCREILNNTPDLNITIDTINSHYLKGGNILKTLNAILYARKNNVSISVGTAFALDLLKKDDIFEIVKWAVNPQVFDVEPYAKVVTKDGIQITLKTRVTVRGIADLFMRGSREKLLFSRINEATAEEIPKYESYKEVLKSLNTIADHVFGKLTASAKAMPIEGLNKFEVEEFYTKLNEKEAKLNQSSAYEVLDIKIYDIIVGEDTLAEYKLRAARHNKEIADIHAQEHSAHAHGQEVDAKIRLINAKAKVQEGMAEAFKNGGMDFKNYQTEKHIFDAFEDDPSDKKH